MNSNKRGDSSRGSNRAGKPQSGGRNSDRPTRSSGSTRPERPSSSAGRSDSRGPARPKGLRMGSSNLSDNRNDRPARKSEDGRPPRYAPNPRKENNETAGSRDRKFERPERNERPARHRSDEGRSEGFDKKPFNRERNAERNERPARQRSDEGRSGSFEKKPFNRERDNDRSNRADGERSERPSRPEKYSERAPRNKGGKGPGGFSSKPSQPKSAGFKSRGKEDDFIKKNFKKPKGRTAEDLTSMNGEIRLNRFLSVSGIASRREADDLIAMGLVTVNGKVVTEMGHKVRTTDEVKYNGQRIRAEQKVYVLLNKPKGFITAVEDPKARKTVMDLLGGNVKERIYPVGRLDRSTTGVLLFTNDGDMAKKLTHPAHGARKIYLVTLDKPVTKGDLDKISKGIELEDGIANVDAISYVEGKGKNNIGIELQLSRNRIVRRIFESLGYEVTKLDRSSLAGLTKKNLNRGQWRYLTDKEVNFLKML